MALTLFDTNIFIDMLNGVHEATVELGNYGNPAISVITYMELRSGEVPRPKDKPILDAVLAEFTVLQLSPQIIEHAISIRGNTQDTRTFGKEWGHQVSDINRYARANWVPGIG
ncbi:hypothetical protein [Massilia sp. erpn]|uniref:hypothetical protein n=1 Tax=Massilia sp. erpn TaxID=2738142 RepID=UPI002102ADC2|nr:hypothetical protein [Massilia sp. erpn]UTY60477.1 hypothetical protein HPQ68_26755 [Massilia sp. erpn]